MNDQQEISRAALRRALLAAIILAVVQFLMSWTDPVMWSSPRTLISATLLPAVISFANRYLGEGQWDQRQARMQPPPNGPSKTPPGT